MVELTQVEVDRFWEMGCKLEAMFVPGDELARAFAERRIQWAYSFSTMGTGDLGWRRPADLPTRWLEDYAVVPPGQEGDDWPFERMMDERNTETWLWEPFRADQDRVIAGSVDHARVVDAVVRHLLTASSARAHGELCDWLISGDSIDHELIRSELATTHLKAPEYLRAAVSARWLTRSVHDLLGAISLLEIRSGDYNPGRARRMAFLKHLAT